MPCDLARILRHGAAIIGLLTVFLVAVWANAGTVRAEEYQCVPYDTAVANLESHGWTHLPDIPVEGYSVDRLLVARDADGYVGAVPVYRDGNCALAVPALPLGVLERPVVTVPAVPDAGA